jgi:mono/diheme cytochrome c family protein
MKSFLIGLIVGLLVIPVAGYFYIRSGRMPVATSAPPMPLETYIAHTALHAKLAEQAPKTVPIQATEDNLMAGAEVYRNNCSGCHGLPGHPAVAIADSLYPRPPQLFAPHGMVTDDPPGVSYWKVRYGIRLTGMPAFSKSLTDMQMWQVSLLLAKADQLPAAVLQKLGEPFRPLAESAPASPSKHKAGK